ncbi:2-oxoacid:acceptor oxidoreductase subunit alpha [Paludibaculum fermentans]|uniref:2-oxoacid:acceptor oxidoreductase subunit alpha n=1 Tax=Paludibaculum fermentans TaxID=1473598 RepID=A0A7S7NPE9_PALFE|nr:2-oxoacid:acceptor oxidoreductase subunit alpha [Paludibaculum fermentans]QOY87362.1 2-oxoacid:acceptor oxidoreductase subunit alpha [Paludibaculum fermentans]
MMHADPNCVLTGTHFMNGDAACCEGALAAGARFAAGYPITPSTEVVERFAARVPKVGGIFIQMEDELAASIALQGMVWAGAKSFTVTSGPGYSLMMEHIGFAAMTETPCVFVNVQRGGPSTGLPTLPAQGDMMQARFGSHGDYSTISLVPNSPQECFSLTVKAFNLAEQFRVPVMFMMDECVGHMTEKVVIPDAKEIEVTPRRHASKPPGEFVLFEPGEDLVPEIAHAGEGYKVYVTGLTHDKRGYPLMNPASQKELIPRLFEKISRAADELTIVEAEGLEGADVVVVSYGITSRVAQRAIEMARDKGLKVGKLRLICVWPFPEKLIRELAPKVKALVMPELNMGQVVIELERCAGGQCKVISVPHPGGTVHKPADILAAIERGAE